jgi:methylenetetrahydrofolate dehydrogenase (NADP+)/methenyltetrahydrofolate cyclohydrolase
MQILDGKLLSQQITTDLISKVKSLIAIPTLAVVLVGDDPASLKYINLKIKKSLKLNIPTQFHHLPKNTDQFTISKMIKNLNQDPQTTAFFVQLPLPTHIDKNQILNLILPTKDVDGLNPNSGITPAVVLGIIKLLKYYKINFTDKKIVIINDSPLIGQPLKKFFESQNTFVTLANDKTKDLKTLTQTADILISATGVKNLITSDMVKQGSVVVDVASGDVDFDNVAPKTSYITPTFGGVGPMTVISLFENLLSLAS